MGLTGFNLRRRMLARQTVAEEAKRAQQEQAPQAGADSDDAGAEIPKRRRKKED